jgi:voltage-gated potassium channel
MKFYLFKFRKVIFNWKWRWILPIFTIILLVSGSFIHNLEPETFPTVLDGVYWTMTTISTVGYGDFSPKTDFGKVYAMLMMIFGYVSFALLVTKLVDTVGSYNIKKREGRLTFMGKNHIVVIYYSKKSRRFIQNILEQDEHVEIVLVDMLSETPMEHPRLHYVQGLASKKETLEKANLKNAKTLVIFANPALYDDTEAADGKTLLISSMIERNFKHIHSLVEIVDKKNVEVFEHAKIDEYIFGDDLVSELGVLAALNPGKVKNILEEIKSEIVTK